MEQDNEEGAVTQRSRLNFSELKINRSAKPEELESSDIDEQTERYLAHLRRQETHRSSAQVSARLSKHSTIQHRSARDLHEKYAAAATPGRNSEYLISKISSSGPDSNSKYDNINQISHSELPIQVFKDTQELDPKFL
mgnify:CR=1 FL=1